MNTTTKATTEIALGDHVTTKGGWTGKVVHLGLAAGGARMAVVRCDGLVDAERLCFVTDLTPVADATAAQDATDLANAERLIKASTSIVDLLEPMTFGNAKDYAADLTSKELADCAAELEAALARIERVLGI